MTAPAVTAPAITGAWRLACLAAALSLPAIAFSGPAEAGARNALARSSQAAHRTASHAAARPATQTTRHAGTSGHPAAASRHRDQHAANRRGQGRRHRLVAHGGAGSSFAAALSVPALPASLTTSAAPDISGPRAACLAATRRAEAAHGLPQGLLVAVALAESGLHAYAMNIRGRAHFPGDGDTARALLRAGQARGAVMAGCVQINTAAHARTSDWPLDPERAADWAGAHLRQWYDRTGDWATTLRRWHGGSAAGGARAICRVRAKLEVTAPGSDLLDHFPCNQGGMARVTRSGVALLEMAEAP